MPRLLLMVLAGLLSTVAAAADGPAGPRPNLLVVLADDLGFSDLGCYGSEIDTPTLDRLAAGGLRFTQFATTAKCHSSRVSLLTGQWCRQAGDESMRHGVTIAEVLRAAGYDTAMTGKWHLEREPTDFGFRRYFGHLSGATDYLRGDASFRLDGRPWPVPKRGFYTTIANVDRALEFLADARSTGKPWFLYVAFNAPHAPLQPLEADYRKYLGRYDVGWDHVRGERVRRQRESGLFGAAVEPSPRPKHVPAWDALPSWARAWEARRMAALAGLIDRLDRELGRLVADLESRGELDNTLVLFVSDNGACPYDRRSVGSDREPYEPDVRWSDSTGWAWARNAPFRYYKQNQFEGGIASPAIVHWPAGLATPPGAIVHDPVHLVDVLPTVLEVCGARVPSTFPGRELRPLSGVSLVPVLRGAALPPRPPIHLLFSSDRGLRDGRWKLVSFRGGPWELYDIESDRTELHDLAAVHPEIVARMAARWHEIAEHDLRAPPRERTPVAAAATDRKHPEWSVYDVPGRSAPGRSRQGRKPSGIVATPPHQEARSASDGNADGGPPCVSPPPSHQEARSASDGNAGSE